MRYLLEQNFDGSIVAVAKRKSRPTVCGLGIFPHNLLYLFGLQIIWVYEHVRFMSYP